MPGPLWTTTKTAYTTIELRLPFRCASCGAETTAAVFTNGAASSEALFGVIGHTSSLHHHATTNAEMNARIALERAACLGCGAASARVAQVDDAWTKTNARRRRLRWPLAVGAALVAALVLGIPAIHDARFSMALPIAAVAGVIGAFALVLGALSWPVRQPFVPWSTVALWWTQADGTAAWQKTRLHVLPRARHEPAAVMIVTGMVAAFVVAVGLWQLESTRTRVYVVDGDATKTTRIRVDGELATSRDLAPPTYDVPVRIVVVRTGKDRHLELVDASGNVAASTVVRPSERGSLFAPGARARDLCFYEIETVYADTVKPGDPRELPTTDDAFALERHYADVFAASPTKVDAQHGQVVRRWALRAARCSAR